MRTVAENIVDRLGDLGVLAPSMRSRSIKEVERLTEPDYIPRGDPVDTCWNVRPAPAGERCGVRTGEDIQSGPYYCGKPATVIGDTDVGIVCACDHHAACLRRRAEAAADGDS